MKKFILFVVSVLFFIIASAQEFLTVEQVYNEYGEIHLILSNGDEIYYYPGFLWKSEGCYKLKKEDTDERIRGNISPKKKYSRGDIVYHTGDYYNVENIDKLPCKIIKEVTFDEVKSEVHASLSGTFSYNSFFILMRSNGLGGGSAEGSLSGSIKGGTKTVAIVIFTDGNAVSIDIGDDSLWLKAKPGQKVEHYKVRDTNLYKLVFK